MPIGRRHLLAGFSAFATASLVAPVHAWDARELGIRPDSADDQSAALQAAFDQSAAEGLPLSLPGGTYLAANLRVPARLMLTGVPGATLLRLSAPGALLALEGVDAVTIDGVGFDSVGIESPNGLITIRASTGVQLTRLAMSGSSAHHIGIEDSAVDISNSTLLGAADTAIFAMDSRGLKITNNRIAGSGNGGIRIWRSAPGRDGSIIAGNTVTTTDSLAGGNGQNGNAINVFRANEVIVANNHLADSAFTAVRLNASNDAQVIGNSCINSGEVAIFSEFGFSGSVIANNIVDGAATGISMTNFDSDGRLATCTGNIVRNIAPASRVNPDTRPVGIFAEADAAVTGNVVENIPGIGIGAGWGPYLRNVLVANNVIRDVDAGVVVSLAPGAGSARVAGNLISEARRAGIAGTAWDDVVSSDMVKDAEKYPQISVEGNVVS